MKLTPELLAVSPSALNPIKERQLDLRGEFFFISSETMASDFAFRKRSQDPRHRKSWCHQGASSTSVFVRCPQRLITARSQDQHDAIDLTDNSIVALANFPLLRRLRTLLLANNHVSTVSPALHISLPNLTSLVLTNNNVSELGDLEPLKELKYLRYLSLMGNPVKEKKWYREWLVWRIPSLRVLDFQRIRDKVRLYNLLSKNSIVSESCSSKGTRDREGTVRDSRRATHCPCIHLIQHGVQQEC